MNSVAAILPMAVVMVAGPQIVSAVLLATSENPRRNSWAYLAGVSLAVTIGLTVVYGVSKAAGASPPSSGSSDKTVTDWIVVALLVFLALRVYMKRTETEPPKWMGKLQTATPGFSFKLGFLLFLLMPTDIITMISVGAYLARHDIAWWHNLIFVLITVLFAGIPLLVLLLMGKRADSLLPKMRDWMGANSWIVSEIVIVFFLVMTLSGG